MRQGLSVVMNLFNLALPLFKLFSLQKAFNYKNIAKKVVLYAVSFILFITFYVFGCIAIYHSLSPYWGKTYAGLFLCLLSLLLGLCLIFIANHLKIRKKPPSPLLNLPLEHNMHQDLQKLIRDTSPKAIMAVFGVVFLTFFLVCRGKKSK